MNIEKQLIFIGLSWEERCYLGLKEDFKRFNQTSKVIVFFNQSSSLEDNSNKAKITRYCSGRDIEIEFIELKYDYPIETWKRLSEIIDVNKERLKKPVIDITTLPREIAWMLMNFVRRYNSRISFTYHSPEKYSKKWLSKEPGAPRLLLKHSGISYFDRPTAILLITGFDEVRTKKIVEYYEPKLIVLGIQTGKQFDNSERNSLEKHSSLIKGQTEFKKFPIDAFSHDFGYSTINSEIKKIENSYNVIACSQGPKPTSIALYKSYISHNSVALCYVPSGEFNREYSTGLKDTYKFDVEF